MVIDANMYWLPGKIFEDEDIKRRFLSSSKDFNIYAYEGIVEGSGKSQIIVEKPAGYQNLNYVDGDYMAEKQVEAMDRAGIDRAILKIPGCQEWLPLDLCKIFNTEMAEHVRKGGGRFIGLGTVPPVGDKECIEELERCVKELGMKGIQIVSHYGDKYLDHESFSGFFDKVNELDIPVYVHHNPLPVQYDFLMEYNNLRRSYGRCSEQAIAIGREIFSGMFEKYPNLKFIHSMMGGGFFALSNIMFPIQKDKTGEVSRFKTDNERNLKYLDQNIFFEISHAQPWGKIQMEAAVKILGKEKLIFGTSYPVKEEWLLEGVKFVEGLDISDEDKKALLGENAEKVYNL